MSIKSINEAMTSAKQKHDKCKKDGYESMATFWGGYLTALQDVKEGRIVATPAPKESEDTE